MAATDYLLVGYQAIKALIEADSALMNESTGIRNFSWFDEDDPYPEKQTKGLPKQPGDEWEFTLDWESMTDPFRTSTPTFGNRGDASCAFIGTETHEYSFTLVGGDARITRLSHILKELRRVLRAGATIDVGADAKARLGQMTARNEKTDRDEAARRYRRLVRGRIPVTVTYQGTTQLT